MKLNDLTVEQMSVLHETEMRAAFPPEELKPLSAMVSMVEQGRYRPLGLYEGEELMGYAMLRLEPESSFALCDYLGTLADRRNRGLGSVMLSLLVEYCGERWTLLIESEAPESGAPEEENLRRRRLSFYERNGFRYAGYDCAVFGVHYRNLVWGPSQATADEVMEAHKRIYGQDIPVHIYQSYIQIPLAPGEQIRPAKRWIQEQSAQSRGVTE